MRSASSSRAPSRAATALTASLSMFRTSVPRIDASTFSSLTVVPNVGLARRASAAVCERGGVAFREAEPRSGGSDRVDRIAPRGGSVSSGASRRIVRCCVARRCVGAPPLASTPGALLSVVPAREIVGRGARAIFANRSLQSSTLRSRSGSRSSARPLSLRMRERKSVENLPSAFAKACGFRSERLVRRCFATHRAILRVADQRDLPTHGVGHGCGGSTCGAGA